MEDYFSSKRALFLPADGDPPESSIVNIADPYGRRLARELPAAVTFAVGQDADYSASNIRCELERCRFTLDAEGQRRELELALPGRFNVANALAALATARALGAPLDALLEALEMPVRVPGRLEPVHEGQDFAVLVDYAHTPDSLANVLVAAREMVASPAGEGGRVLCVFGAGGDRDRGKRPIMGEIATRLADIVIVTDDNPRTEIAAEIRAAILAAAPGALEIGDRRAAIHHAVALLEPGDTLIVAGKGHEEGQTIGQETFPFSDHAEVLNALKERAA
jgi:UDP-N-acetylmuramoyl-L-alanyl-D-glutamate--2,6-diaminopimelate ligase